MLARCCTLLVKYISVSLDDTNKFEKEVFIISILIEPVSILVYIIIATSTITFILKNKVERNTIKLVNSIGILPAIPVLWLMSNSLKLSASKIVYLYVPLITTIFVAFTLLYRIVKYKNNSL